MSRDRALVRVDVRPLGLGRNMSGIGSSGQLDLETGSPMGTPGMTGSRDGVHLTAVIM